MDVFGEGLRMGMEGVGLFSIHFKKDGGVGVGGRKCTRVYALNVDLCIYMYVRAYLHAAPDR